MFNVYVTNLGKYNEGELVGKWIELPITREKFQDVLKDIYIDNINYEEYFYTDYECDVDGLIDNIGNIEFAGFKEVNALAEEINNLDTEKVKLLEGILEIENCTSIIDALNHIKNLDCYNLSEDIITQRDVGEYYFENYMYTKEIPDFIINYIDYEGLGRDCIFENFGNFTKNGFLQKFDEPSVYYTNSNDIPEYEEMEKKEESIETDEMEIEY